MRKQYHHEKMEKLTNGLTAVEQQVSAQILNALNDRTSGHDSELLLGSARTEEGHMVSVSILEGPQNQQPYFCATRELPEDKQGRVERYEYYWGEGYWGKKPEAVHSIVDKGHLHLSYPHEDDLYGSFEMVEVDFRDAEKIVLDYNQALS